VPTPLISILIPLFNAERFIEDTLQSVLEQSYRNLEIIIVDDRSTDASVSKALCFKDSRIHLSINEKNLGPEKNWNRALAKANGKYIKLVCCDDLLEKDCITKQSAILENPRFSGVGLVSCSRFIINSQGRKILQRSFGKLNGRYNGKKIIKKIIRSGNNPVGEPVAGLFRSDMIKKVGYYRTITPYVIDLDFWIRLLIQSDIYIIDEPLCSFRISGYSWSARLHFRQLSDYLKLVQLTAAENEHILTPMDIWSGQIQCIIKTLLRILVFRLL
jgi:glycosyltransferase involved in cell wall biosynthesis